MTLKETLQKAGRLNRIIEILTTISNQTVSDYPVNAYVDGFGKTHWRVPGQRVHVEAKNLLHAINTNTFANHFPYLSQYVKTKADIDLHNYANDIGHRLSPNVDLEETRCWLIIESLIYHLNNTPNGEFEVPKGWAAL